MYFWDMVKHCPQCGADLTAPAYRSPTPPDPAELAKVVKAYREFNDKIATHYAAAAAVRVRA